MVECLVLKPYCLLVSLPLMKLYNRLYSIFSNILEIDDRKEIVSLFSGLFYFDLNIGIILVICNASGKIPFSMDLLIVIAKGSLILWLYLISLASMKIYHLGQNFFVL